MTVTGKRAKQGSLMERLYYLCSNYQKAILWAGEMRCQRQSFPIATIESAVVKAVLAADEHPEALDAAAEIYRQSHAPRCANTLRQEIISIDRALEELRETEQATIIAQVAGIRAGGSPDAYASAFADIAIRRKDLEDQRGVLSAAVRQRGDSKSRVANDWRRRALGDVKLVLETEQENREEKRRLIRTVVDKVVCRADGADVYFVGSESDKNIWVTQNSPVCGFR